MKFDTITLIYYYSKNSVTITLLISDFLRIELANLKLV
jgi:hypothetical protein